MTDKEAIKILNETLDLITYQQTEIERFQKIKVEIDDFCRRLRRMKMLNGNAIASYEDLQNYIQEIKSEAIKEFAERLIAVSHPYADTQMVFETQIKSLVKEMVGVNNEM